MVFHHLQRIVTKAVINHLNNMLHLEGEETIVRHLDH